MYAENTGQVEEFLTILKKRKWQIALPAVFVLALSIVLALIIPGKYMIESKFELHRVRIALGDESDFGTDSSINREGANAVDHLKSFERVRRVIRELAWDEYANLRDPVLRREYIRNQIKEIHASTPAESKQRKSSFVSLSYKHVDPKKGVRFISALVNSWVNELTSRDELFLTAQRDDTQNEVDRAQRQYRDALTRLDSIEKRMKLSEATRPDLRVFESAPDRYEAAMAKVLIDIQEAEAERAEALGELEEIENDLLTMEDYVQRRVSGGGSNRDAKIAQIQAEIADLKGQQIGLTPLNSKYKRIEKLIDKKELELFETANTADSIIKHDEAVPNEEKFALEKQKDALELKLGGLDAKLTSWKNRENELLTIMDERVRLHTAREEAKNDKNVYEIQFNEAKHSLREKERLLAAQIRANVQPYHWTKSPIAPPDPTDPNPLLIIAIGLVGGLALGLGSSVVVEFSKNCYRNVGDVTAVLTLPVLGVVNEIVTSAERRSMRFRAVVMVLSSLLMLTVIGWFTWAYTRNQELLPTTVLIQLEEFRNQFE